VIPRQWLDCNRLAWGIENGLHQRLDVSLRDDDCHVRTPGPCTFWECSVCLSNSLFMHWRSLQPRPQYKTTTDFQAHMDEENLRNALRFVTSKRPTLKPAS
jgi:hypothetical protein